LFTLPSDCLQCDPAGVLTEIHIEALLVDEELADEVWEAWDTGEIDDEIVWLAWRLITNLRDVSMA